MSKRYIPFRRIILAHDCAGSNNLDTRGIRWHYDDRLSLVWVLVSWITAIEVSQLANASKPYIERIFHTFDP